MAHIQYILTILQIVIDRQLPCHVLYAIHVVCVWMDCARLVKS
jgi:hypothetical protein